jgi:hypothetical protein
MKNGIFDRHKMEKKIWKKVKGRFEKHFNAYCSKLFSLSLSTIYLAEFGLKKSKNK